MATFHPAWFVCGGWAVDSWLGKQTRDHGDFDITVFHDDQRALFDHLRGWHMVAHKAFEPDPSTEPWDGRELEATAHIHARPAGDENRKALERWVTAPKTSVRDGLDLEILLNERRDGEWVLNADPLLTIPLRAAARQSAVGLPTAVPAVLMFYKATAYAGVEGYPRAHDEADFRALLALLSPDEVAWLSSNIRRLQPEHPWVNLLE
jgi:hypothetical protein